MSCEWAVDTSCLPDVGSGDAEAAAIQQGAVDLAIQVLWALSGRQFGICSYLVRPCIPTVPEWCKPTSTQVTSYVLSWEGDHWVNLLCGCNGSYCRATGPGVVHLPGPAQSVDEVIINGVTLADDQYVLEGDLLYRTGDTTIWPRQDLSRPMGSPNTWSVEYRKGQPVPAGVDRLTGALAKEFLAACTSGPCRLPRTVTQVSRQGISYSLYNPGDIYNSGKTGLAEVDLWLAAVNPQRLQAAPSVL